MGTRVSYKSKKIGDYGFKVLRWGKWPFGIFWTEKMLYEVYQYNFNQQ